VQLIREVF